MILSMNMITVSIISSIISIIITNSMRIIVRGPRAALLDAVVEDLAKARTFIVYVVMLYVLLV